MTTKSYESWGESELIAELKRRDYIQRTCKSCGKDYMEEEYPKCSIDLREVLINIFNYLDETERRNYETLEDDSPAQEAHIYQSVITLGEYLELDMTSN